MELTTSSVGRKVLMAVSGLFLLFFVIVHLMGNLSVFGGPDGINAYAEKLHGLGPFVWAFRLFLLAMAAVHVLFGILLTLDNWASNPNKYAVKKMLKATFAGETMIWTGGLILAFAVYHILQFTVRVTPDIVLGEDAKGRFDVFTMVVTSFKIGSIALIYVAAMIVLFLHVSHGAQSFLQTLGWSNEKTLPTYDRLGKVLAALFLIGFSAIPVSILVGILPR
jgi:succinate dehydrogenase / fumarate reductase, cytochrome b subunit